MAQYLMRDGLVFDQVTSIAIDQVTSIAIDHQGNKWIGTTHGVSYFDGAAWTNYYEEDGLQSNSIGDIIIDLEGNVWFGTATGLSKFYGTEWISWFVSSAFNLAMDPDGTIWAIANTGIIKLDNGIITEYTESNSDIASNTTTCIAADNDGNIIIGHYDNDISIFDGENRSYIPRISTYTYDIEVDVFGNKWISHCCGVNAISVYDADNSFKQTIPGSSLINKFVNDILFDDQGNKWFGANGGLSRYDGSEWTNFSIPNALTENDIMGIDIHPDGSVWFGTMNGIYVLNNENWSQHIDLDLVNNETYDIRIESSLDIWAGTTTGATHYDGNSWTGYTNASTGGQLADNQAYSVVVDQNDMIWFGTHSGLSITNLSTWNNPLPGQWIHDILIDNNDTVWVATHGDGIYKFAPDSYTAPVANYTTTDGLATNNDYSLACDQSDNIWIGCQNGPIAYYDGSIHNVSPGVSFNNSIRAITVDDLNNIWFAGAYYGILKYDGAEWIKYNIDDGLTNNYTNNIIYSPADKTLWAGTDVGISKISCFHPTVITM